MGVCLSSDEVLRPIVSYQRIECPHCGALLFKAQLVVAVGIIEITCRSFKCRKRKELQYIDLEDYCVAIVNPSSLELDR